MIGQRWPKFSQPVINDPTETDCERMVNALGAKGWL
jgi:hypothetical protein